jgi:hypothetical protein
LRIVFPAAEVCALTSRCYSSSRVHDRRPGSPASGSWFHLERQRCLPQAYPSVLSTSQFPVRPLTRRSFWLHRAPCLAQLFLCRTVPSLPLPSLRGTALGLRLPTLARVSHRDAICIVLLWAPDPTPIHDVWRLRRRPCMEALTRVCSSTQGRVQALSAQSSTSHCQGFDFLRAETTYYGGVTSNQHWCSISTISLTAIFPFVHGGFLHTASGWLSGHLPPHMTWAPS